MFKRLLSNVLVFGCAWFSHAGELDAPKHWIFLRSDAIAVPGVDGAVRELKSMGIRPVVVSRWLHAVSAFVQPEQVERVLGLPWVGRIQPVACFRREPTPKIPLAKDAGIQKPGEHRFDYGTSFTQNRLIHVPEVHDLGLTGKGIRIGMLDTGFTLKNKSVFSKLRLLAEYDFVFGDPVTANQAADPPIEEHHGTQTLSVIGGFEEGKLVGPAFEASFAVGKTEWQPTETRIEEDRWVAGLEWLVDSLHVQVVSSSLGYNTFDDGSGYSYRDMDGATCITTVAADLAVKKGAIVVVSAGNEGSTRWRRILSPADGDSVIAVGAVTSGGNLANFSSVGPTSDNRIKPDVAAMGVGVTMVDPDVDGPSSVMYANGTSFSCPQVAGVCALVLQAHPELNPIQVRDAVRLTSSRVNQPDTLVGWGIPDAYNAVFYHGPVLQDIEIVSFPMQRKENLSVRMLTRDGMGIRTAILFYQNPSGQFIGVPLDEHPASGRYIAELPERVPADSMAFFFTLTDSNGTVYHVPVGAPQKLYAFADRSGDRWIVLRREPPKRFMLYQNYPNPFNEMTRVSLDLAETGRVRLWIADAAGRCVLTLTDARMAAGSKTFAWNGCGSDGTKVPSGLYFLVAEVANHKDVRKMVVVR